MPPAFPIDAARLTPHARPMLAVDVVLASEAGSGLVALRARADAWYMRGDGTWDEVAGVELISQAAAAISGLTPPAAATRPPVCFLAEVRRYRAHGIVRTDDDLRISIQRAAEFGGFFLVEGTLRRGDDVLAEAELTFWRDERADAGGVAEGTDNG
jgi:predicted hotdog family 3-hydroxylacyl-ACP dehydratase